MTQPKRHKSVKKIGELSPTQTKRLNERLLFWDRRIQGQKRAVADSERLTEADFAIRINTRG